MKLARAQNSSNALNNRLSAHANYAKFEINDWIIPKLEIKGDDQVLDIACGNGKQLIPISETINENGSITGLDLSLIHISEPTRRYAISYAVVC